MRASLLVALLASAPAYAADDDAAALNLADKTVTETEPARDWRVFSEAAWSRAALRHPGAAQQVERLSLGVLYDTALAPEWRIVVSDRFDARREQKPAGEDYVNTLEEAYVSWQPQPGRIADLGRINTRYGVAYAYNPTDYFRAGAVRSIVSTDPTSQRENRLGSVMARGQSLWTGGSLTALVAPKLADHRNDSTFSPDFGATNGSDRWLLAASQKISQQFAPQVLMLGAAGQSPQVGVNLSVLLGEATVANVEWSGGRARSLQAQSLSLQADTAFRSRLATGITYTTSNKLSWSAEYEYNGAALDRAGWEALGRGSPADYGRYRAFAADVQDPPTRHRVFLRAFWQDAALNHFDLTSNVFIDLVDHSRQLWVEGRYHWTRVDAALQWQRNDGSSRSQFGALAERRIWQAVVRYFL